MERLYELDELDLPFHHCGRPSADLRGRNECAALSLFRKQVACQLSFLRGDHRLLPVRVRHVSNAASNCGRAGEHALVGAVQVYAGLTLVNKVGAGAFVGLTVTAALTASLMLDHYGWFHMPTHAINTGRITGAALMIGGVFLISRN